MASRADDRLEDALARELAGELDDSAAADLASKCDHILADCNDVQRAFIDDPWKRKVARCPRRAGKTTSAHGYAANELGRHAGEVGWYIGPTLKQARRLAWAPLRKLSRKYSLNLQFHKTEAAITWSNESQLWLAGADDDESIAAILGHKPRFAIIDEVGAIPPDRLERLIDEIEPSLLDSDGTLVLTSTPGVILAGLFYEISGPEGIRIMDLPDGLRARSRPYRERRQRHWKGVEFEWSLHTWTLKENTARPDLWKKALALKKTKGWSDENPRWRRPYLGEWTHISGKRPFGAYDSATCHWDPGAVHERNPFGLPEDHAWRFLIGLDLGSTDPMAIQVGAYSLTSPLLLQVHEWEADVNVVMTTGELAAKINEVVALCGGWEFVEEIVADHGQLGDTVLETLSAEHSIFVEKADKKNKYDHIELTNGELKDGRTKILKRSRLAAEMSQLHWDPKRPGKYLNRQVALVNEEGERVAGVGNNHTDAWLYLSTRAHQRNSLERTTVTTEERRAEDKRAEAASFIAKRKAKNEPEAPRPDIDWETTEWQP